MALLNTDYKRDVIVTYKTSSISSSGSGGYNTINIPHGLAAAPLIYVQWSETSDFNTPRELPQNFGDLYPIAEPWVINAWSTSTNIVISFQNWGASSKTIYFRVWGMPRSDVSVNYSFTAGSTGLTSALFNTDLNYLKLYMANRVSITAPSSINHGLGYNPVVMIWEENNPSYGSGTIAPLPLSISWDSYGFYTAPTVSTSSITFKASGIYHYRIYLDII